MHVCVSISSSVRVSTNQWDRAKPLYEEIYPVMKSDADFLYNYGAELSLHKEFAKSIKVLTEAKKYYSNSNLYIYLGINFERLHNFKDAETNYLHASYMVPSKMLTKYLLFNLYKSANNHNNAVKWAEAIIKMPIKAANPVANTYKLEAVKYLQSKN
jgi:Tfp pilus assembly protein PilF